MSKLFENAVHSIQLGFEDYQASEPKRAISAVRNFYAGVLLLAKEVLVRKAPNADPEGVIGARYKPLPDGSGGVRYESASHQTIDFAKIGERFKDFNLPIDRAALDDLNRVRNDVEHFYTQLPHAAVREAIAKAMPVVAGLFRLINVRPSEVLDNTWQEMLEVRNVYEAELADCQKTFEDIDWPIGVPEELPFNCPNCQSHLVAQMDRANTRLEEMECRCRVCDYKFSAEMAVEQALETYFELESYFAATDGGDQPIQDCPECGLSSYLLTEEHVGCVWCGFVLGKCGRCMINLTPDIVDPGKHTLCSYCGHLWSKDD